MPPTRSGRDSFFKREAADGAEEEEVECEDASFLDSLLVERRRRNGAAPFPLGRRKESKK